jgi:hypothetical protein
MSKNLILPKLTGSGEKPATQEIHIFLLPLNPDEEILQNYYKAVNEWNETHSDTDDKMKACFLALVFRDSKGNEKVVKVMQSARYFRSDDTEKVVQESHKDSKWFKERGFEVVREKIEASAYGISEIPLEDSDLPEGKYFEFHIKVGRKDRDETSPITPKEIEGLRQISRNFSSELKVPVPLSYNENKNKFNTDGQGHQRFLNMRFRKGRKFCKNQISNLKKAIEEKTGFYVIKVISEYVWYDTYKEMDNGWIDYSPEELKEMFDE